MILNLTLNLISYLRVFFIFLLLAAQATSSCAYLLNYTIDDTLGDALTGSKPVYDSSWVSSADCGPQISLTDVDRHAACGILFDGSSASNKTWHAVLGTGSLSIMFNGSSIYAYFIIPSILLTPTGSIPTQVGSNLSFILDGDFVHDFVRVNRFGTVKYNVPGYKNTSLTRGIHNLTILSSDTLFDGSVSLRTAAVFDYAVYTVDDGMGSSSREIRIGFLVLGIVVGISVLCLMAVGFFFLRLRARQRRIALNIDTWKEPLPRLTITHADDPEMAIGRPPSYHKERLADFHGGLEAYKLSGPSHEPACWQGTLQPTGTRFPIVQLRRGSASRLEAGVNLNVRNSLMVGVDDVLRRNAVENRDAGTLRRRSTLSRLGIPLGGNSSTNAVRSLESIAESSHSPNTMTKRRSTVGNRHDSFRVEVGSRCEDDLGMQDDRSLIMRLQAEIRMLHAEREIRLDLARIGLGFGLGSDCGHGEELPDYDSVV